MPYKDPEKKRQHEREYWHRSQNAKARSKKWQEENREKQRELNRKWYVANREKRIAETRVYTIEHPEIHKKAIDNFRINNYEQYLANSVKSSAKRRARKANAPVNDFTVEQWQNMKLLYHNCCAYCGKHMERLTQDHIIPLSRNGSNTQLNIVPSCKSCNSKKHAGPPLPIIISFPATAECPLWL